MKTKICLIIPLIVLLAAMSFADAATITIELPDLVGELHQYPNGSVAVFDFGTSFLQIDEVRIQLTGTFTPGLAHGDGVEIPANQWLEVPPEILAGMDSGLGFSLATLSPSESPFHIEEPFALFAGATWDFLLDGRGELLAELNYGFGSGWVVVTPPSVELTEAYLTVQGTVPEPSSLLLGSLISRIHLCKTLSFNAVA